MQKYIYEGYKNVSFTGESVMAVLYVGKNSIIKKQNIKLSLSKLCYHYHRNCAKFVLVLSYVRSPIHPSHTGRGNRKELRSRFFGGSPEVGPHPLEKILEKFYPSFTYRVRELERGRGSDALWRPPKKSGPQFFTFALLT